MESNMKIGEYIKLILNKKNMSQQDLVDKLNELGPNLKGGTFTKQYVSNRLNGINPITPQFARMVEIVLDLSKYELVNIVGYPETKYGIELLKSIDKV